MVSHWRKAHHGTEQLTLLSRLRSHSRILINGGGAIATALALIVILVAKFREGAWIVTLAVPSLMVLFKAVRAYYARLESRLKARGAIIFKQTVTPAVLLPVEGWNHLTAKAISFAVELSTEVTALHVSAAAGTAEQREFRELRERWAREVERPALRAEVKPPRLVCVRSRYRRVVEAVLEYVTKLQEEFADRLIAIVIPELIKVHWWEHLLHTHRALRLRRALLKHGGARVIVVSIPWYLDRPVNLKELGTTEELADPTAANDRAIARGD
jgi:hypothetical protein